MGGKRVYLTTTARKRWLAAETERFQRAVVEATRALQPHQRRYLDALQEMVEDQGLPDSLKGQPWKLGAVDTDDFWIEVEQIAEQATPPEGPPPVPPPPPEAVRTPDGWVPESVGLQRDDA